MVNFEWKTAELPFPAQNGDYVCSHNRAFIFIDGTWHCIDLSSGDMKLFRPKVWKEGRRNVTW